MPSHFIPNLSQEPTLEMLRRMEIILTIGEDDPFLDNNRQLNQTLWDKHVWHALHLWPGRSHKPRHWQRMIDLYL